MMNVQQLLVSLASACTVAACAAASWSTDPETRSDAGPGTQDDPLPCELVDSDEDGYPDVVEAALGSDQHDATGQPGPDAIYFVVPYQRPPSPVDRQIVAPVRIARADVSILLDTTGSMAGTTARIQGQFQSLVQLLAAEVDDLAFGAAGYGDFPIADGANSQYDVPFYPVHRIMTARTAEGLSSLLGALHQRNIIDGLGPWFSQMRGGDEPEQGWEALRQLATGVGISYPGPYGGTQSVPPFAASNAYPQLPPIGEEVGTIGGLGFRDDSLPIVIMVSDTDNHEVSVTSTVPAIATRTTALQALADIGARVVGIMAWQITGHDDLEFIANSTGGHVTPLVWGTGADRPANCPAGRCCVVADDPSNYSEAIQPLPVDGLCSLVFRGDRYDTNLAQIVAQAVVAVVRGTRFDVGAELRDDESDDVDAVAAFVSGIEAVADGSCQGAVVSDSDGDSVADFFDAALPGSEACFRVTAKVNQMVPARGESQVFRAAVMLTGNGLANMVTREVVFVVPATTCDAPVAPECAIDDDCPPGEFCTTGRCLEPID